MRVPRPLSSFIGHADTLASVAELLADHRLVTLTGTGGTGKTRVSLELAQRLRDDYPDGIAFVPLAPLRDPTLIPSAVAQQLGLQDSRGRPLPDHLADYLSDREVLLVLDNFEHLLAGAPVVADLLAGPGKSRILVTSRAPLRLSAEHVFPVSPLPLPAGGADASDATALFVDRARAHQPAFKADRSNADAIASIVRRLDGLPLAIELAAARVTVLPPAELLARLDDSLTLLVGGRADLPDRHQTLRSTIAWSHDLLSLAAQRLFATFAAFRGGAALTDLEVAAADLEIPVVDAVQELVDHSLLRTVSGLPRYAALETVREFAAEQLASRPEAQEIHATHAAVFRERVEPLERPPIWPSNAFLAALDLDHDNVRAALDWLQEHDPPTAVHMAAKLSAFWSIRGHFGEGRRRLRSLLDLVPDSTPDRVAALQGAAWLALDQGDTPDDLLTESIEIAHALGDRVGEATGLLSRGRTLLSAGDVGAAAQLVGTAKSIFEADGDRKGVAAASILLGAGASIAAPPGAACAALEQCVELCGDLGLTNLRARTLQLLGIAHIRGGNFAEARAALAEGVPTVVESGDRFGIALGLGALIMLSVATSRLRLALRLAGVRDAFERLHEVTGPPPLRRLTDQWLAPVRSKMGASVADTTRDEGRGMTIEQAVKAALANDVERPWQGLTPRETDVAELVASGLTNREIADRLVLSVRTVETHVDRILGKLGFTTRGQLTAWAHEHGLMAEVRSEVT